MSDHTSERHRTSRDEPGREPGFTIRQAGPADDDRIVRLLLDAFAHLYASMGLVMSPERAAYLGDQAGRRSFATCFVCERDGALLGTVTILPPSPECEAWIDGAWDLRLLAVEPAAQRGGVARALLDAAERHARDADATAMCLHARRGMAIQSRFYPSAGYVRDPAGDVDVEPYQEGYSKRL